MVEVKAANARLLEIARVKPFEELEFGDIFDIDEIQAVQDAFAKATGVASIITDVEGRPITKPSNFCQLCEFVIRGTKKGLENCMKSDAALGRSNPDGPILQPCLSGGLWDGGTSIYLGDRHIANWLIGQVLTAGFDEEKFLAYGREIGADEAVYREAMKTVKIMDLEQFKAIGEVLFLIARQLSRMALQTVQQSQEILLREKMTAEREELQQQVIEAQRQSLKELATPIIPLMEGIIVMPLIGSIDSLRAKDLTRALLQGISSYRARVVILDITGVPIVDSGVASHLNKTIQAARLKGTRTIITGVSDAVAETVVDLGIDWSGIETLRDLQTGLMVALGSVGYRLAR